MLRLPPFRFLRAGSLAEAAAMLAGEGAEEGRVRLVAGGTDLWPNMKRRHQKAGTVVSLMGIPGLAGVAEGTNGGSGASNGHGRELRIGATTLLDAVERDPRILARYPALARAVASISSPPLRNMGTLGGNLCVDTRCTYYNQTEHWRQSISYCMKAEGAICWVATSSPRCLAHTASDAAPMLCALGARVRLVSAQGERAVPIEDLYRDDGIHYLGKRPDEILAEVLLPPDANEAIDAKAASEGIEAAGAPGVRCRSAFWKLRRRGTIDFAVLSAAVCLWTDPAGVVTRARIWLGAVASAPVDAAEAAESLVGRKPTPERIAHAARLARRVATPFDNTDFQAQWRSVMVERYTAAALAEAAGLDPGRMTPGHPL